MVIKDKILNVCDLVITVIVLVLLDEVRKICTSEKNHNHSNNRYF